jgi:hypothetical protein
MTIDAHQKNLEGKLAERIAAADVVFAVWQDDTAPLGFGFMPIKGQQRLPELTDDDATLAPSMTGIKCDDSEQAFTLVKVAAEPIAGTESSRPRSDPHQPADPDETMGGGRHQQTRDGRTNSEPATRAARWSPLQAWHGFRPCQRMACDLVRLSTGCVSTPAAIHVALFEQALQVLLEYV